MIEDYEKNSDEYNFRDFDMNIIVGYLSRAEGMIENGKGTAYRRDSGIVIYDNKTDVIGKLEKRATEKILFKDRGKLGKIYDKNKPQE